MNGLPPPPSGTPPVQGEDWRAAGPPRAVLDANVFVAAGFRPASASGRLVEAARDGQLVAAWTDETRAEAERVVGQIPPLRGVDLDGAFRPSGRWGGPLGLGPFAHVAGRLDQTLAALAAAAGVPLVTADGPLLDGARAAGAVVLRPAEAARALGL